MASAALLAVVLDKKRRALRAIAWQLNWGERTKTIESCKVRCLLVIAEALARGRRASEARARGMEGHWRWQLEASKVIESRRFSCC